MKNPINLLNFDQKDLVLYFDKIGLKRFNAVQVFKWIHQKGVTDINSMTNISKLYRTKLKMLGVSIIPPKIILDKKSNDGTYKFLIEDVEKNYIETIYIPERNRGTLCISSQVGCSLNCSFCYTAKQGFNRNLNVSEIIGQVWIAIRYLSQKNDDKKITNIVFMGMGEPLMNFHSVIKTINILLDKCAYGLSKHKITLSTSGVVPGIYKLINESDISLAISLHASNNELRNKLVPINKKFDINQLMEACKVYTQNKKKKITFEYILIDKINDQISHAQELVNLLNKKNIPSKINLIPFNSYYNAIYKPSQINQINIFKNFLIDHGFIATVRKTRGNDIDGACGQLSGKVLDKTNRQKKYNINYKY